MTGVIVHGVEELKEQPLFEDGEASCLFVRHEPRFLDF
jgi:hypothetical protein